MIEKPKVTKLLQDNTVKRKEKGRQGIINPLLLSCFAPFLFSFLLLSCHKISTSPTFTMYNQWQDTNPVTTLYPTSIAASGDGRDLFIGDIEGYIHRWDIKTRKIKGSWKVHKGKVSTIVVSSGGGFVVSGGFDTSIGLIHIDVPNTVSLFSGHTGSITSLYLTADDKHLISGGSDRSVMLWNMDKKIPELKQNGFQGVVTSLTFWEKGGKIFAGFSEGYVHILDAKDLQIERGFEAHRGVVSSLRVQEDREILLSSGWDRDIKIWDIRSMQLLRRCIGHEYWVSYISLYKNKIISAGSFDHSVRVWDIDTCRDELLLTGHQSYVHSVVFSGDGRHIFSLTLKGEIRQWDAKTGELLYTFPLPQ